MNLSGFDDCMKAASEIQGNTQGERTGHLGNRVNSPVDSNDHIAQFNAGLDAMSNFNVNHIPLSESGSFDFDVKKMKRAVDSIRTWLKSKLLTENGYKAMGGVKSDVSLEDKTSFLKDMAALFVELDDEYKNDLIRSLSAYITSYDIKSVRELLNKLDALEMPEDTKD